MIKAFLFDMDGVLVDSEDISITVGIEYFNTLGVKANRDSFSLGGGERVFFDSAAERLGVAYSYADASAFFKERYLEIIKDVDIALPGAVSIINSAKSAGIMTALASSAPHWKVMANLRALGLDESAFDFIATGKDVKRNKPFGDIYTLSLINLGIGGEEAVVFEDSKNGIISGKSAGCTVVSLMTTIDGESAGRAGADGIITDLSAFPKFSTKEEAEKALRAIMWGPDAVVYGANAIPVRKSKESDSTLLERAKKAAKNAWEHGYAPYSTYKVGAALVSASSGKIYSGCNVENSSYGATICAERNAITNAITAEGAIGIELLVVYSDDEPPAPPCAVCLQVIAEFARPDTPVVLVSAKGKEHHYRFSELLPNPFIFPTVRK